MFQRCPDPTSAPSRGRPLLVRLYSLAFPTQLLGVGCERLREWSRSRRGARETRPSTIVASTWVTVIACELFWTQLGMGLAARHCTLVIANGARPTSNPDTAAPPLPHWTVTPPVASAPA